MIGRSGREVYNCVYIYGKKTYAYNVDEKTENEYYKKYRKHHTATCSGYTPKGEVYISDYCGKFGKGKMIFENHGTLFSNVTYLIEKN